MNYPKNDYFASNPSTPNPGPSSKKAKLNLNVAHQEAYIQPTMHNYGPARNTASGGRGLYNCNFWSNLRLGNTTPNSNEAFVFIGSKHKTLANAHGTSARITELENNATPARENMKIPSPSYGCPPTHSLTASHRKSSSSYNGIRIIHPVMKGRVLDWSPSTCNFPWICRYPEPHPNPQRLWQAEDIAHKRFTSSQVSTSFYCNRTFRMGNIQLILS
jgi:hypothetical protein